MKALSPVPSLSVWLKSVRRPFLDFLRNLTPQIFVATLAWFIVGQINFQEMNIDVWIDVVGFFLAVAMFVFAFYANTTLFFEEAFKDLAQWISEQENGRKSKKSLTSMGRLKLLQAAWRERRLEVIIAFFMVFSLYYVSIAVLASSLSSAINLLKLGQ